MWKETLLCFCCCLFETWFLSLALDVLKPKDSLPLPPKCWGAILHFYLRGYLDTKKNPGPQIPALLIRQDTGEKWWPWPQSLWPIDFFPTLTSHWLGALLCHPWRPRWFNMKLYTVCRLTRLAFVVVKPGASFLRSEAALIAYALSHCSFGAWLCNTFTSMFLHDLNLDLSSGIW